MRFFLPVIFALSLTLCFGQKNERVNFGLNEEKVIHLNTFLHTFYIDIDGQVIPEDARVVLYDLIGKTQKIDYKIIENKIELSPQNLTAGIYFIQLLDTSDRILKLVKVIKR